MEKPCNLDWLCAQVTFWTLALSPHVMRERGFRSTRSPSRSKLPLLSYAAERIPEVA